MITQQYEKKLNEKSPDMELLVEKEFKKFRSENANPYHLLEEDKAGVAILIKNVFTRSKYFQGIKLLQKNFMVPKPNSPK